MAFSEALKLKVKKKAMFQCCRCHSIGIDIHHIIPQKNGGPDDISNAAPLCQNCHDQFGDNPQKRKEIVQMRDNWYEKIENMYSGNTNILLPLLKEINESLKGLKSSSKEDMLEIKKSLKKLSNEAIDNIAPRNIKESAKEVLNNSVGLLSKPKYKNIRVRGWCKNCDLFYDDYPAEFCPKFRTELAKY